MDFDLDGKADILWRNKTTGDDDIWLMNGIGLSLSVYVTNNAPGSPWVISGIGDFDKDGKNDILWSYVKPGDPYHGLTAFWKMNGTSWTGQSSSFWLNSDYRVRGAADFNRDGYCDILWESISTGVKAVQYMDSNFQTSCANSFGDTLNMTNYQMCATADLDGDHIPDIILRDQTVGYIGLWFMKYDSTNGLQVKSNSLLWNTTTATPTLLIIPDQDWKIVGAGNFHSWTNGNVDLLVRHATLGYTGVWTINGTNYLSAAFTVPGSAPPAPADTDWRIATQDVADSYWRLQSDFHKLSATVSTSPTPRITLNYYLKPNLNNGNGVTIQRRLWTQTTEADWQTLAQHLAASTYIDADTFLQVGQRYEYRVFRETNVGQTNFPVFLYPAHTFAGINASPIENRGKILLLIDNTLVSQLTTNITRLQSDLVGDGWTVITNHVARHNDTTWSANTGNIASIKGFITNTYNADSNNTKAVFMLGHVTIPYSGWINLDGHLDHFGAWPADLYFTSFYGTWTDNSNVVNSVWPADQNTPGDGKFDQSIVSNRVQLAIGRVDFATLPVFSKTEVQMLKDYLDKDRRFRQKQLFWQTNDSAYELGVVYGNFVPDAPPTNSWSGSGDRLDGRNTGTFENAVKNCSSLFGDQTGKLIVGDPFYQRTRSYLWAFQAGNGNVDFMFPHSSLDLTVTTTEPTAAFYGLWGSTFGDWNLSQSTTNVIYSNFLRSMLTPPDYGLAVMWTKGPLIWRLDTMAMGEHLGQGFMHMVNDPSNEIVQTSTGYGVETILGDPTLRLHVLAPPAGLTGQVTGNQATLTWNTNNAPGVQYYIYKASGINGSFTNRISPNAVNGPSFTNSPYSSGTNYMVRALQLKTSGSGSYTNISQGAYWP